MSEENKEAKESSREEQDRIAAQHRLWKSEAKQWLREYIQTDALLALENHTAVMKRGQAVVEGFTEAIQTAVQMQRDGQTTGTQAVKKKFQEVMKQFMLHRDEMEKYLSRIGNVEKSIEKIAAKIESLSESSKQIHALNDKFDLFVMCMQAQFPNMPRKAVKMGYKPVFRKWLNQHTGIVWGRDSGEAEQLKFLISGFSATVEVPCHQCRVPTDISMHFHQQFCLRCLDKECMVCDKQECIDAFWNEHREECELHDAWKGIGGGGGMISNAGSPMNCLYTQACEAAGPSQSLQKVTCEALREMDKIMVVEVEQSSSSSSSSSSAPTFVPTEAILPRANALSVTARKNILENNELPTVDVKFAKEDRDNLIIGGMTSERFKFSRNRHYTWWQFANESDICPAYATSTECDAGESCEFLHLKVQNKYGMRRQNDKEFERYNKVQLRLFKDEVTEQLQAYVDHRGWRQYYKGMSLGSGVYDPIYEEAHKAKMEKDKKATRKANAQKGKKRKGPGASY